MIIIWGHRWYGRAAGRGDQGIAQQAFHLWYIPLIPAKQMWISHRRGKMVYGMPTRWSWGVAAPIIGIPWGLIAMGLAASITPLAAIPVGVAAVMAVLWGMRATSTNGPRARLARDMTAQVLGTGCPAELLEPRVARELASKLDTSWAEVCPDRSPEDVAALGPRDRREAALAYTLLAVRAGFERGALATRLRERAAQVLDGVERAPALPQGAPYRAEVRLPEAAG